MPSTTLPSMAGRRDLGSWLDGPGASAAVEGVAGEHPGARLGRPAGGPGAVATFLRRVGGITVDWVLCIFVAQGLLGSLGRPDLLTLAVLLVEHVLLVGTLGATVGHRVLGLRVETLDGRPPGPVRALVRSVLLVLVVPALLSDQDNRGPARPGGRDGRRLDPLSRSAGPQPWALFRGLRAARSRALNASSISRSSRRVRASSRRVARRAAMLAAALRAAPSASPASARRTRNSTMRATSLVLAGITSDLRVGVGDVESRPMQER